MSDEPDLHGDPEYTAWLAQCASECTCCPECSPTHPCEGAMAGGVCDWHTCTCHDEPDNYDDDLYGPDDYEPTPEPPKDDPR